jgi:hypothetical protein
MKRTNTESSGRFAFYIVDGVNNTPDIVCLKISPTIDALAGPYDDYQEAKKMQEYLKNIPPTP